MHEGRKFSEVSAAFSSKSSQQFMSSRKTVHGASLALPPGELSPQVPERALPRLPSPSSLRSDTSPKGRGKKGFEERKFLAYIHQTSRERSKKTASVFLVSSRRSGGKSKSLQTLFLSFSFGEAKENAGPHSQICRRLSNHCKSTIYYFKRSRKERPLSLVLPRM